MAAIDFKHKIYNLIPHFMRKPIKLAWLYVLIKPIEEVHILFCSFKENTAYKLTFTSETNVLEYFLNDQFDPVQRRIFIVTINENDFTFIHNKIENKLPTYVFNKSEGEPPLYLYTKTELLSGINYTINVPMPLVFDELVLRAKVNCYNQAGKNYEVVKF